ncbi:MAG: response regulator [Planctomycetota bacterium]
MAKILIVDDSRLTRRLLAKALDDAGHETVQVKNGEEGLRAFEAFRPDCVISDLLMPVMDGFAFAAAIREIDGNVPVLISTADIQERTRERCEEIGVTRLLNKPVKAVELCGAVDAAVTGREVTAQ